jgi:hypothetical protein
LEDPSSDNDGIRIITFQYGLQSFQIDTFQWVRNEDCSMLEVKVYDPDMRILLPNKNTENNVLVN